MNAKETNSILVPAPSAWPFMLALGITLILWGLLMHAVVSIVGAVVLLGSAIGWWFDVLPVQKEELVPVTPDDHVATSSLTVDHLAIGHRVLLPLETHPYLTGVWGG